MAIDTRNERSSILGINLPGPAVLPDADGSISTEDRQQVAQVYRLTVLVSNICTDRASMLGYALPVPSLLPCADGILDAGDRAQLVWMYSGLYGVVTPTGLAEVMFKGMARGTMKGMH